MTWLWTASFWLTVLGAAAVLFGWTLLGAVMLTTVGYGGMGIMYSIVCRKYRGGYSDVRAFVDIFSDLPRKEWDEWLIGSALHAPQAMAGTLVLAI